MQFFTDITTNASNLCLLNVKQYNNPKKLVKKACFIDPGVYELVKGPEYSRVEFLHELARGRMAENEFLSIDYPCDMNSQYTELFIEKSIKNNLLYADNLKYITTIQYAFMDYTDFIKRCIELDSILSRPGKIIGLGNMCRIMRTTDYMDACMSYLINNYPARRVHIYGLSIRCIKKYVPILEKKDFVVSVDSTKWTRAVTLDFKKTHGVCARKANRDEYLLEYIKEIQKCGIEVEF